MIIKIRVLNWELILEDWISGIINVDLGPELGIEIQYWELGPELGSGFGMEIRESDLGIRTGDWIFRLSIKIGDWD